MVPLALEIDFPVSEQRIQFIIYMTEAKVTNKGKTRLLRRRCLLQGCGEEGSQGLRASVRVNAAAVTWEDVEGVRPPKAW